MKENFVNDEFKHVHQKINEKVEKADVKEKESFLMHNGENLTRSISSWIEKLSLRGNFDFKIGEPISDEEIAQKFPGDVWHPNEKGISDYGDKDMLFPVYFGSWKTAIGDSTRNIEIKGHMPVHTTYNGAPSFGWSKNDASTPKDCLKFTFWKDGESTELSYGQVRDIINSGEEEDNYLGKPLEKYLWDMFLRAHFCQSENIPQVDNR